MVLTVEFFYQEDLEQLVCLALCRRYVLVTWSELVVGYRVVAGELVDRGVGLACELDCGDGVDVFSSTASGC